MDLPSPCKKTRLETGTCNVCAAPCSSCMHFNFIETGMESKNEEGCSNTVGGSPQAKRLKGRQCNDHQTTASGTSNLMSASSSHDPYSENAESKLVLKNQNEVECIDVAGAVGGEEQSGGNDLEKRFRASGTGNSSLPLQDSSEDERSESDAIEDDVKVCDICGDAGREDLLAVCSRCSDGAEHTYCMRTMLEKVPEGEWLCEGCELEIGLEKEKSEKKEGFVEVSSQLLEEKLKDNESNFNAKNLPKSDVHVKVEEKSVYDNAVTSPHKPATSLHKLVKRQSDNVEISSTTKRGAHDMGLRDSGKKPLLSREYSTKNFDTSKLKHAKINSINDTDGPSHSGTTSITTSRGNQVYSPKRLLGRSNTFSSTSLKPKIRHLRDQMYPKQKLTKGNSSHDIKREGLSQKMDRSLSFRISSPRHADLSDSKLKEQSPPRDSKCPKFLKDKYPLERRSSFKSENLNVSSVPSVLSNTAVGKSNQPSFPYKSYVGVKSDTSGGLNKQASPAGAGISGDKKQQLAGSKDEIKLKDLNLANRTQRPVSAKPRSTRCSKCDCTGHTSDLCSVSTSRCTSVNDPVSLVPREGSNKSSNWKHVIQAALFKIAPHNNAAYNGRCNNDITSTDHSSSNKLSDRQDELPVSKVVLNSKIDTNKDQPLSLNGKNVQNTEVDEAKPSLAKLSTYDSLLDHSVKNSVIPELDFLWQGCFEVLKNGGRCSEIVDGLQAHLSSFASPKVPEVVKKFDDKIRLEEVPRLNCWPVQFRNEGATEDNIAVYIFAKDVESYDRHYKKLVENMEKNQLVLKGNVGGNELLIYCSNQLPVKAHRWNGFLYLWAVFRERKADFQCTSTVPQNDLKDVTTDGASKALSNQLTSKEFVEQKFSSVDLNKDFPASNTPEPLEILGGDVTLNMQSAVGPSVSQNFSPTTSSVVCTSSCGTEVGRGGAFMKIDNENCKSGAAKVLQSSTQVTTMPCLIDKSRVFPVQSDDEEAARPSSSIDEQQKFSSLFKKPMVRATLDAKEEVAESGMALKKEEQDKRRSMADGNFIDLSVSQGQTMNDDYGLRGFNLGKKRDRSLSLERTTEDCVETAKENKLLWSKDTNPYLVEDQIQKKMKCSQESYFWVNSIEKQLPPTKIVSTHCSSSKVDLNEIYNGEDEVFHDIEKNTSFFQVDIGPSKSFPKATVHVISDDDDDDPQESGLHLGLALGSKKRTEREVQPLFFIGKGDEANNLGVSSPDRCKGDDDASSLSLSLAFPESGKEPISKSVKKPHPVVQESLSKSVMLFGGRIFK